MNDRTEARMLLLILRERWDEAAALARRRPLDPSTFVELTRVADVHPTIHALLESSRRWNLIGDQARARLDEMRRKCRYDNLLLLALAEKAIDRLLENGIVPVVLKGLDTLHRFGLPFDERTFDDIDLLVREEQLVRTIEILESGGWKAPSESERTHWLRSAHHIVLSSSDPVPVGVEIHWNLVQERRYRLRPGDLFERARPLDFAGRPVLRLEDHDAAAHLLVHHLAHYFDRRLKWALDLRRISASPDFAWTTVAARLDDWGGRAAAGMSLLHLRKVLPELVGPEVLRVLPVAGWRRVMTLPLRSSHPLDLFRWTRRREVQLYLAAALMDRPSDLPGWIVHRQTRDSREESGPLGRRGPLS